MPLATTVSTEFSNSREDILQFRCNICSTVNEVRFSEIHRELTACSGCNSNARFRGVVKAIQRFILSDSVAPLRQEGEKKTISGIGMSDSLSYATELERIFNYRNTFYHMEPYLDVTNATSAASYRDLDFVISSEVLEHVRAPVTASLKNIFDILKPGGALILTVPYLEGYETIEHYPHLNEFEIVKTGTSYSVVNKRPDDAVEYLVNPRFHGGPGAVLEMRVFGEGDLFSMLRYVGFGEIHDLPPTDREIGYFWEGGIESHLWRGRRPKSHVLVCHKPMS
jgi:SAM-dependent methyltransferase